MDIIYEDIPTIPKRPVNFKSTLPKDLQNIISSNPNFSTMANQERLNLNDSSLMENKKSPFTSIKDNTYGEHLEF